MKTGTIKQGEVIALFAFDVGFEVDLEKVGALLLTQPAPPLSKRKQNPPYLQYTRPPRIAVLEEIQLGDIGKGQVHAKVFDFGAISISCQFPLPQSELEALPEFSKRFFECDLETEVRKQAELLFEKIKPAIERPVFSSLVEDYYVFAIEALDEPIVADELLANHGQLLAQALRFEREPISIEQQRDALSKSISYYCTDLVLIDWNAAILFDLDYADALSVLELLNIELLEARHLDAELDKRVEAYESILKEQPRIFLPLLNPYRETIQELAELRIESALLSERINNALKLIGDLYLARIHDVASERFYISTWNTAISRKLDIIGNLYKLLTDRIGTTQGQTLELIIILLIMIEIFMMLAGNK